MIRRSEIIANSLIYQILSRAIMHNWFISYLLLLLPWCLYWLFFPNEITNRLILRRACTSMSYTALSWICGAVTSWTSWLKIHNSQIFLLVMFTSSDKNQRLSFMLPMLASWKGLLVWPGASWQWYLAVSSLLRSLSVHLTLCDPSTTSQRQVAYLRAEIAHLWRASSSHLLLSCEESRVLLLWRGLFILPN